MSPVGDTRSELFPRRCGESVDDNGLAPSEVGPPFVSSEARTVRSHPSRHEFPPGAPSSSPPFEAGHQPSELSERATKVTDPGRAGALSQVHGKARSESSEPPYPEAPPEDA